MNVKNRRKPARQIADLMPDVLSDALAKKTGMTLDLIAGWEDIAGPEFAPFTLPEKITWPRHERDPGNAAAGHAPGMLHLAYDGHRALFIQHALPQLVERLNGFFGYEAVDRIRLVQKPVARQPVKRRCKPEIDAGEQERLDGVLERIGDERLRKSLERMGRGVIARQRRRPGS